jgi:hypothetical protein
VRWQSHRSHSPDVETAVTPFWFAERRAAALPPV